MSQCQRTCLTQFFCKVRTCLKWTVQSLVEKKYFKIELCLTTPILMCHFLFLVLNWFFKKVQLLNWPPSWLQLLKLSSMAIIYHPRFQKPRILFGYTSSKHRKRKWEIKEEMGRHISRNPSMGRIVYSFVFSQILCLNKPRTPN